MKFQCVPLTTCFAAMVIAATLNSSSTRSQFVFNYLIFFKYLT